MSIHSKGPERLTARLKGRGQYDFPRRDKIVPHRGSEDFKSELERFVAQEMRQPTISGTDIRKLFDVVRKESSDSIRLRYETILRSGNLKRRRKSGG